MNNSVSEEPRDLSLQEMEETCGGDAAAFICNVNAGLIGAIWSGAVTGLAGGLAGALVGAVVGAVISTAAC